MRRTLYLLLCAVMLVIFTTACNELDIPEEKNPDTVIKDGRIWLVCEHKRNGEVIDTWEYDSNGRLLDSNVSDDEYDSHGNVLNSRYYDQCSHYTYEYDSKDRIIFRELITCKNRRVNWITRTTNIYDGDILSEMISHSFKVYEEPACTHSSHTDEATAHNSNNSSSAQIIQLLSMPDPDNYSHHKYAYDSSGKMTQDIIYERDGSEVLAKYYKYDEKGNKIQELTHRFGKYNRCHTWSYDDDGNVVEFQDFQENGKLWQRNVFKYNESGLVTHKYKYLETNPLPEVELREYDSMGRETLYEKYNRGESEPTERETRKFDSNGRLTEYTITGEDIKVVLKYKGDLIVKKTEYRHNKVAHLMAFKYDDYGNLIKATKVDSDGKKTVDEYKYVGINVPPEYSEKIVCSDNLKQYLQYYNRSVFEPRSNHIDF
ncbi:MAG: hypothetical protein IJA41_09915 [Clostridia bacterium]|nr:hypothetical protein [Clostridia bacterium]